MVGDGEELGVGEVVGFSDGVGVGKAFTGRFTCLISGYLSVRFGAMLIT